MTKRIESMRWPGRAPWADEVLEMLGAKVLPAEGMPERLIQGVRVYVRPLVDADTRAAFGPVRRGRNWQGLRVMAICDCGKHVAVGRLAQHTCKGLTRREAMFHAEYESRKGYVQHVNRTPAGWYRVDDWCDGSTVASFENGRQL